MTNVATRGVNGDARPEQLSAPHALADVPTSPAAGPASSARLTADAIPTAPTGRLPHLVAEADIPDYERRAKLLNDFIASQPDPAQARRTMLAAIDERAAELTPAPPSWWPADRPHPAWCDGAHEDDDEPDESGCFGPSWFVDLSLPPHQPDSAAGEDRLTIDLVQYLDDPAPKVWLGAGDTNRGRHLTPGEARALAAALVQAADTAEADA